MRSRGAQCAAFWALFLVSAVLTSGLLAFVVVFVALLVIPRRLGHHRIDVLGLFVPILGLVWLIRLLWRITHLSTPYWSVYPGTVRRSVAPANPTWPPPPNPTWSPPPNPTWSPPPNPALASPASSTWSYCSGCGTAVPGGAHFCTACGRGNQEARPPGAGSNRFPV
jgi:hypothetical protein